MEKDIVEKSKTFELRQEYVNKVPQTKSSQRYLNQYNSGDNNILADSKLQILN